MDQKRKYRASVCVCCDRRKAELVKRVRVFLRPAAVSVRPLTVLNTRACVPVKNVISGARRPVRFS